MNGTVAPLPPKTDDWQPIVPAPEASPEDFVHFSRGTPTEVFEYRNQAGALEGYVRRFDFIDASGKGDKDFRPLRYGSLNGRVGWHAKGWGNGRPLYRLATVLEATDKPVLVVEGERKADRVVAPNPTRLPKRPGCPGGRSWRRHTASPERKPRQSKAILVDDAVHAAVSRPPQLGGRIPLGAAVTHGDQQIDDYPLEEARGILEDAGNQFGPQSGL